MALTISFLSSAWLVYFRNEARTTKLSVYLYVCLPSFTFNNFRTDRSASAMFGEEHQVSNISGSPRNWENSGLGGRQKCLKDKWGWINSQAFRLALPAAKDHGWLCRLLLHSSKLMTACGASCNPHVCRGEGSLQSEILGAQRGNENMVFGGSREDKGILLWRGVCGRGNCRRRYGFIVDVEAVRWRDVGHGSVGNLALFLPMDMEQHEATWSSS